MPPRRQSRCFFFSNIMCKKLYIKKINPVFAIAKTKAEDNINIISLLNSAYKKIRMNDKMKHLRRCFRIAAHGYKDFFTKKTSDEQNFSNEKAVCQRYGFPAYVTVDIT